MCVANARWFFNRTGHIVIGVAQLVGEQFNFIWSFLYSIIEHSESSWGGHSLTSSNGNEVELVSVFVSDGGINNSSCSGVSESSRLTSEYSSIHTLARVDIHEFALVGDAGFSNGCFDLVNFGDTDSLNLTFTYTISVEDDTSRISSVVFLEGFKGTCHS